MTCYFTSKFFVGHHNNSYDEIQPDINCVSHWSDENMLSFNTNIIIMYVVVQQTQFSAIDLKNNYNQPLFPTVQVLAQTHFIYKFLMPEAVCVDTNNGLHMHTVLSTEITSL